MIRVFLVDDHPIVRAGLRALLSTAADITVVGEAGDGGEVLRLAEAPDWSVDVVVLDISLPRVNGIETLRRLVAMRPSLPVLMLSMFSEAQYARRLVGLGAAGYVSKDRSEHDLISAVRTVADGRLFVTRAAGAGADARAPHQQLSARQLQVFSMILLGRTVSEIAAELDLSVSTISTHLGHVKAKLGVKSLAELVNYAHHSGLTSK